MITIFGMEYKRLILLTFNSKVMRVYSLFVIILYVVLLHSSVYGQNQFLADSLKKLIKNNPIKSQDFDILYQTAKHTTSRVEALKYAYKALEIAKKKKQNFWVAKTYQQIAFAQESRGNLKDALKANFNALEIYQKLLQKKTKENRTLLGIATTYNSIGGVYTTQQNYSLALEYLQKALKINLELEESQNIAGDYNNIGEIYRLQRSWRKAEENYQKSYAIYKKLNSKIGVAYTLGNLGLVYAAEGNKTKAEKNIRDATEILETLGDYYPITVYLTSLAEIYLKEDAWDLAHKSVQRGYMLAKQEGLKEQIRDAARVLSKVHQAQANYKKSLQYHKEFITYKDSIVNAENIQKMADLRTEFELSQKQKELDLAKEGLYKERMFGLTFTISLLIILLLVAAFSRVIYRSNQQKIKINQKLSEQKEELSSTNERLMELNRFKERMTGMLVHDLKNPLNTILGLSKVPKVQQAGKQMLTLVLNILDIQKFENTTMPLTLKNHSLKTMVSQARQQIQLLLEQKNLQIKRLFPPAITVKVDEDIFERILTNILSNAIKYSPYNAVIEIGATEANQQIKINIRDYGKGIPKEKQSLVFEKFTQIEGIQSGGVYSTGLGLTFCKMAIEAHHGEIGVNSEVGKGADFWFTVPSGNLDVVSSKMVVEEEVRKFKLAEKDTQILIPFVQQMQKIDIFEYTQLKTLLNQIDTSGNDNIQAWKEVLEQCIINCNEEKYKELQQIILKEKI